MYFWSMPENRLELWAWLESSRLANTVPREFYKERSVVLEERRMRTDSNPFGRLFEQLAATAYVAHNYGRSGVGWPSELSQITATEAMAFHKKYYVGSNIVIAVVGDVKASEAMPVLEKYFSKVPGGPKPLDMTTVEPKQFAEKSVVIKDPSQPIYVESYHRPGYRSPDDAVYDAISDILSNGRVSRLYRSLVRDQQIAAEAAGFGNFPGEKYPSLFTFGAIPLPGHSNRDPQGN
jgi:predicted Zn-dependent peptidase